MVKKLIKTSKTKFGNKNQLISMILHRICIVRIFYPSCTAYVINFFIDRFWKFIIRTILSAFGDIACMYMYIH